MDRQHTKKAIGQALRVVRNERGLAATEAAKQLGVSRQTIWNWENGERTPDAVDLANIAATYKTKPERFFDGAVPPLGDPLVEAEDALARAREFMRTQRSEEE